MIEWNDSTQLKTKKMPRPSCWFASLDNTNQWDSQASESSTQKEKGKRRDRFFFFILLLSKNTGKAQFFQHFPTVFQKDKKYGPCQNARKVNIFCNCSSKGR